mgnify:FL=1
MASVKVVDQMVGEYERSHTQQHCNYDEAYLDGSCTVNPFHIYSLWCVSIVNGLLAEIVYSASPGKQK